MRYNGMALLVLAGTVALAGCGSQAAPTSAPSGLSDNAAPAVSAPSMSAPAVAHPAPAQPAVQAPATGREATGPGGAHTTPAAHVPTTSGAAGATTSGSGTAAPAASGGGGGSSSSGQATSPVSAVVSGGAGEAPAPAPAPNPDDTAAPPPATGGAVAPPPAVVGYGNTDFIVFASNRYPGGCNNDIYVFDPLQDTVLAVVGVNTPLNEFNPRMSDNGRWLVFQRTVPSHAGHCRWTPYGNQDILLYSMDAKMVNTLHGLNTENWDEFMPDITNDGCKIVYVSDEGGYPSLRMYDVTTGDNWVVPGAGRNFADITWPTIAANGLTIAYGASSGPGYGVATDGTGQVTGGPAITGNALYPGESNIYVYDVAHGVQLTPPFVNTAFDEYNPELCADGSRMLFVSNRLGSEDIFETNLVSGMTDNLSFLNTPNLDEQQPRYLGGNIDRIVFQIKAPYGPSPVALRAYNRTSAFLDTLPVANQLFADSALRAPQPEVANVTP